MCRQFGLSIGPNGADFDISEWAAIMFPALTKGGPHAYGWLTTRGQGSKVTVAKFAGRADTIVAQTRFDEIDAWATTFIGHTRWATHGSPLNLLNDHPIRHGNIVGVHNGVIFNYDEILKVTGRQDPATEVDSEAIFAAVNRWGHKRGLSKLRGNMVAVYTDLRKPHVVSIAKTEGRPITLGWDAQGNMYWASEKAALEKAAAKLGIEMVRWSGMKDYRHLTVRAGKIVTRLQFAPPPPLLTALDPPVVRQYPQRAQVTTASFGHTERVRRAIEHAQEIEGRRGEWSGGQPRRLNQNQKQAWPRQAGWALADHMSVDEKKARELAAAAIFDDKAYAEHPEDYEGDLFFYNGQYLTADAYVEAIRDSMDWD